MVARVVLDLDEKNLSKMTKAFRATSWPRHRENMEFDSYFFQTGKHREFCRNRRTILETQGKYFVFVITKSMLLFVN